MPFSEAQRGIFGAGNLGTPQRGRSGTSRLEYESTAAKLFGTTKHSFQFGDQAQQSEFQKLVGDRDLSDGEYYGDYAIAKSGEQNVLPGYERVGGYMARRALRPTFDEQAFRDKESERFTEDLQVLRRRAEAPGPESAPAPAPAPAPPAPQMDAGNPSLADALRDQSSSRDRPALQDALNSALRLHGQDAQERPAAEATDSSSTDQQQGQDRSDRRFAASDRWRKRLAEATGRLA